MMAQMIAWDVRDVHDGDDAHDVHDVPNVCDAHDALDVHDVILKLKVILQMWAAAQIYCKYI